MPVSKSNLISRLETTRGCLLHELQIIWDEVGESDDEKDRMLLELEQECLEVYRRKMDEANRCRAQLRQAIADAEAELADICSALGEPPVHIRPSDKNPESLKDELKAIVPPLEEMRKRRNDRKNQFVEVLKEIRSIKNEIAGSSNELQTNEYTIDEVDLSIRKLGEFQRELQALQNEKNNRLKQVLDSLASLHSLCLVLGLDFKKTVNEIHLSLGEAEGIKNISDGIIEQLETAKQKLRELKIERMQQLQDLGTSLLELWNLMDTPLEEQQMFRQVTCNLVASEDEITEPDMLSLAYINHVKQEVHRLEELKASKMKELVLKKKDDLECFCKKTHLIPDVDGKLKIALDAIESVAVDASCVLEQIELQIARVKEEALSRKDILEKVEKWMSACEEESWLEEYNRDDNRYNAGRGAHLMLKRAEKARALVNKLPAMVETLASKTIDWEKDRGTEFTYDGVPLLSMLEEYTMLRKEKEIEQKRQRDQKKLQGQLLTEQEAIYGSKPSPVKTHTAKKGPRPSCNGTTNRRLSLGTTPVVVPHTPKPDMMPRSTRATPNTQSSKKNERVNHNHKDDGFTTATGWKCLDMAVTRKPFSPISSKATNATKNSEDAYKQHNEMFVTPPKIFPSAAAEEENVEPHNMVPFTPSSAMKLIAVTPTAHIQTAMKPAEEEIEYSFEERRAGFCCLDHKW